MKKCICCGLGYVDDGGDDICIVCGWQDDDIQNDDPDFAGGANTLPLNEYRKDFEEKRKKDPTYIWEEKVVNLNYGANKPSEFSESATGEDINKYHKINNLESLRRL